MRACDHGFKSESMDCPPPEVAAEFVAADEGHFKDGRTVEAKGHRKQKQ